ncbi:hypothetical protein L1987_48436 [Smallanthus sonchifolius]|uniref:Uncharacterized protein n=1 Tax=Smallanthus sonchifolius TaxID=185202 RepID=A0ACB9FRS1_9ASTR|nr:hypothetical protein L1987_48436 [Smallanthus sonchifolius]
MSFANPEPTPLKPIVSDDEDVQEEPDQVSESDPEEESEEEPVGGAEGANFDTDSRETMPYSVMHGEDTSNEEVRPPTPSPALYRYAAIGHCLLNQLEIGVSSHQIRPKDAGPIEHTRPPSPEMSEPQLYPEEQLSKDASEDSDAIIEALDDYLVQLQSEVGLHDLALGRLHGRVTVGETRLTAVEKGAVPTGQRDAWTGERLDSFAALTIINTMLLAFILFRGWFS